MSFNELAKCMYDLEVFPTILSKNRLFHIFSALSSVREENEASLAQEENRGGSRIKTLENYLKDEKMIEFSGFLLGIIETAQEIGDHQLVPPQKLIVLLEKVNEAKGYKAITSIDLVKDVRKKFGSYYASSFTKPQKHIEDFD